MEKFNLFFSLLIVLGFFALGIFLLLSPSFSYLNKEIRIIFAVFLFLYGTFRTLRIILKSRKRSDENS